MRGAEKKVPELLIPAPPPPPPSFYQSLVSYTFWEWMQTTLVLAFAVLIIVMDVSVAELFVFPIILYHVLTSMS